MTFLPMLASRFSALAPTTIALRAFASASKEVPNPTYTYKSPGSSIMDPVLGTGHSLGNPVYEVDSKSGLQAKKPEPTAQEETGFLHATRAALRPPSTVDATSKAPGAEKDKPSYVYAPPGTSLHEAAYGFSVSDPVYHVDPQPAAKDQGADSTKPSTGKPVSQTEQQPVSKPPPPTKRRVGLQPDEYSSQTYTVSGHGSMREPRYVSVSDPLDK